MGAEGLGAKEAKRRLAPAGRRSSGCRRYAARRGVPDARVPGSPPALRRTGTSRRSGSAARSACLRPRCLRRGHRAQPALRDQSPCVRGPGTCARLAPGRARAVARIRFISVQASLGEGLQMCIRWLPAMVTGDRTRKAASPRSATRRGEAPGVSARRLP
jgi:hypothetical protein